MMATYKKDSFEEQNLELQSVEQTGGVMADAAQPMAAASIQPMAASSFSFNHNRYIMAPFSYHHLEHEAMNLGTGALTYSVTDLVLPGRNGFDLKLTRTYNSTRANTHDPRRGVEYENTLTDVHTVCYSTTHVTGPVIESYFSYHLTKAEAEKAAKQYAPINHSLYGDQYRNYWIDEEIDVPGRLQKMPPGGVLYTFSTDTNAHFNAKSGLGQGWNWGFSTIECVPRFEFDRFSGKHQYDIFLHLADGRSFSAPGVWEGFYTLKDTQNNTATDVKLEKSGNEFIISYPDGRKEYFATTTMYEKAYNPFTGQKGYFAEFLNCVLTRMEDRFGNAIRFSNWGGGRGTITDSCGRVVTFTRAVDPQNTRNYTISVSIGGLPDNEKLVYRVENASGAYKLASFTDQEERTTTYTYKEQTTKFRYFEGFDGYFSGLPLSQYSVNEPELYEDKELSTKYILLQGITHPSGGTTHYIIGGITSKGFGDSSKGGYYQTPYYTGRYDLESDSTTKINQMNYTYSFANGLSSQTTMTDGDGNRTINTLTQGRIIKKQINEGANTKKRELFFTYGSFRDCPPTVIRDLIYRDGNVSYERSTQATYDREGNPLTMTDMFDNTTTMTYDTSNINSPGYGVMIKKTYFKDATTQIIEENMLSPDRKSITQMKVSEIKGGVETVKKLTKFVHDPYGNVKSQSSCYGDLSNPTDFIVTHYDYQNGALLTEQRIDEIKDLDGNLVPSPNGAGVWKTTTTYDEIGRPLSVTDPNGNTTVTTYDGVGRVLTVTDPMGARTRYEYDDMSNTQTVTNAEGYATRQEYSSLGKQLQTVDLESGLIMEDASYDKFGRVLQQTKYSGTEILHKTAYTYDPFGRTLTTIVTDADGNILTEEQSEYLDAYHIDSKKSYSRVLKTVIGDEHSPTQVNFVDSDIGGRVIRTGGIVDGVEYGDIKEYDIVGNVVKTLTAKDVWRSLGYTQLIEYDYAGRVLSETDAFGQTNSYTYDALGHKTSATDKAGRTATFEYDALGRLLRQTTPFVGDVMAVSTFQYDMIGQTIRTTVKGGTPEEPSFTETVYEYDKNGRVVVTSNFNQGVPAHHVRYEYDKLGNQTKVLTGMSDPNDLTDAVMTENVYNRFNQVIKNIDQLGQESFNTYDQNGTLLSKTDRNGTTITYEYDKMGRTLKVVAPESTTSFTYTKLGLMRTENNESFSGTYQYDGFGRLKKASEPDGVTREYEYDVSGMREKFVLTKDGITKLFQTYNYDHLGRLVEMHEDGSLIVSYEYDVMGNRVKMAYPNGITETYTYNDANLVTTLTNMSGDEVVSSYAYTYYLDGNQRTKTDHEGVVTTYIYDDLGRLVSESDSEGNRIVYTYDQRNNRATMTESGEKSARTVYTYDLANQLLESVKISYGETERTVYHYDKNGNQVGTRTVKRSSKAGVPSLRLDPNGKFGKVFRYNSFGQLTQSLTDGFKVKYTYRPDGMRHSKATGGEEITHIWDNGNIVGNISDGDVRATYLRGINLVKGVSQSRTVSYLFNAHGDVMNLLDENGDVAWRYDYDAFGVEKEIDGQDARIDRNPFRFCGEYFDRETSTIYLRNRNYDPDTGRFMSRDMLSGATKGIGNGEGMIDPLSLNLYAYCGNSPVRYVDPSGMETADYYYAEQAQLVKSRYKSGYYDKYPEQKAKDWAALAKLGGLAAKEKASKDKPSTPAAYPNTQPETYDNYSFSDPTNTWVNGYYGEIYNVDTPDEYTHIGIDFHGEKGSDKTEVRSIGYGVVVFVRDCYPGNQYDNHAPDKYGGTEDDAETWLEHEHVNEYKIGKTTKSLDGFGNLVIVQYGDYYVYYAHLYPGIAVKVGEIIGPGRFIGYVGNTGNSTGTHLHLEFKNNSGVTVSPGTFSNYYYNSFIDVFAPVVAGTGFYG